MSERRGRSHLIAWPILIGSLVPSATAPGGTDDDPSRHKAAHEIVASKCLTCHNPDQKKGGLDLSQRSAAIAGGKNGPALAPMEPDESLLLEKLEAGEMPPKNPLKPEQIVAIREWVKEGASYPPTGLQPPRAGRDWWSLQPLRVAQLPAVSRPDWCRSPVDRFILARLDAAALAPNSEADRLTWLRRVCFDLTGLPPTPDEVAAFERDTSPAAYERVVDRLLASPAYGERWGRHWLDVARFAESHGYETNALRPDAWPYRDWVVRAFNTDLPFARFVEEQFAADQLTDGDWLTQAATGFLVGGVHDVVGNQTVEGMRQQRADDLDDMIAATGQAFLGLSLQCARCHDHKFDPITQRDYYGMKAIFAGIDHSDREVPAPDADQRRTQRRQLQQELAAIDLELDATEPLARPDLGMPGRVAVNPVRNVERLTPVVARFVRFTVQATNNGIEPCIDELEVWTAGSEPRNVALAAAGAKALASSTYPNSDIHRLEHINDGRTGNSRSWISAVMGKGWVQIELPEPTLIDRIVWGRDREAKFSDRTATEYYIEIAENPGDWHVVASSADRLPWRAEAPASLDPPGLSKEAQAQREALHKRRQVLITQLDQLADTMRIYAGRFRGPDEVQVLKRGDVMQPGDPAPPTVVDAVSPPLQMDPAAPEAERRKALARWLAHPRNPLPARVMVNRVWQFHFGRGLVSTSADFGYNGERPSHPELLDWLAAEYLANGGQLKPLHRKIVLSAAYRQASDLNQKALALDSQNRLLWRFAPRRLEAESIRDAMLSTAGTLDRRMGGPGFWIWEPNTNYVVVFKPLERLGPEHNRRMVYQYRPRSQHDQTFGSFDCPDAAFVTTRRNLSTTALQALDLLNSSFVLDQARALSQRIQHEAGEDAETQVARAFKLVYGRIPSERERTAGAELVRKSGTMSLCRALYNSSEFLTLP
jgi:mono/diheme cytochrome c family protein